MRMKHWVAAIAMGAAALASAPGQAQEKKINFGWTAWADAEAVTKLAQKIIQDRFGYEVELTLADIGIQYQGVATGKLDGMLMSWQPVTHQAYMEKVGKDVNDIGPIYTQARLGWVVPTYVPEDQVKSIEDLKKPEVQEKLSGKIQGIDPGAGLMRASDEAIKQYGLDKYELISASEAGMLAALERATKRNEWIVVTAWSPHWKFAKWDLRYLEDPKGVLGGLETVHKLVRKDFHQDHPEVYDFLNRMVLPMSDVEAIMAEAQDTSYEQAIEKYIEENKALIDYWVTGKIDGA